MFKILIILSILYKTSTYLITDVQVEYCNDQCTTIDNFNIPYDPVFCTADLLITFENEGEIINGFLGENGTITLESDKIQCCNESKIIYLNDRILTYNRTGYQIKSIGEEFLHEDDNTTNATSLLKSSNNLLVGVSDRIDYYLEIVLSIFLVFNVLLILPIAILKREKVSDIFSSIQKKPTQTSIV